MNRRDFVKSAFAAPFVVAAEDCTKPVLSNGFAHPLVGKPRLIAPGVFTPLKRIEMAGKPFLADIAPESFEAGHMVLTVAPGGKTYNYVYVTADDESMKVTGAYDFVSRGDRSC